MEKSYWHWLTLSRLSRRRALKLGAGSAAVAAALSFIGCGGGGDDDAAGGGSGLRVAKPIDTTSQAKPGGTLKHFMTGEPAHFDVLASANANVVNFVTPYAYPRLLKWKLAKYPEAADGTPEGYAAESFEVSGDKLQITFKLRQGMKWDPRSPTNGRVLDSQDVKFSFDKFGSINQLRTSLIYNAQNAPLAPVESLQTPDANTVVLKLRQPDSRVIALLVSWDTLNIMPREADGGFDPRRDVRGHGPWLLDSYEPSVRMVYKKNPDFYIKERPFPDTLEIPFIVDYTQRLAQFKAGNIYTSVAQVTDIIQTKKDVPDTVLQQGEYRAAGGGYITFGWEGDTPWKDARLRQALSMSIDYDGYADTIENRDAFAAEGLDLPLKFNSIVYAAWTGAYLDPRDEKEFGPSAKYLRHNPSEAKKLMAAAGHPNGLEFDWVYSTEQYGAEYVKSAQLFAGMFSEVGFKPKEIAIPYQVYQQRYSDASYWKLTGVVMRAGRSWSSLAQNLFAFLHPSGSHYHGAAADGGDPEKGDPRLTDMVLKIVGEFDLQKQNAIVHDLIRYYTQQAYSISRPSNVPALTLSWPVIGNHGLYSTFVAGAMSDPWLHWWIDPSKPPLA